MDDTGVAHILEHTVLCGSQKFPIRDPFFKMINRSLQTFMNAMTGPDYTIYPFSSMNVKDYNNLLQIYVDACLYPVLDKKDFLQEGWRLEHEDSGDFDSDIIFKGVVFNEMKGATDPDRLFYLGCLNNLLPGHTYSYESGGEPLAIPTLTYEDLVNFHKSHYNPKNSWCVTYGDQDPRKILEYLEGQMTPLLGNEAAVTKVPLTTKWTTPRNKYIKCMSKNTGKPENMVAVNWLWEDVTNAEYSLIDTIISQYLMSGPASPMYKNLIMSGLGTAYSTYSGMQSHLRESYFSIGVRDTNIDNHEEIEKHIIDTINQVLSEGFDETRLKSLIHSYEISLKENKPSFGLHTSFAVMPSWQHGADPIEILKISQKVAEFGNKDYDEINKILSERLKKLTIDNPHRLTLVMKPDEKYVEEQEELEAKLLEAKKNELSKEELDKVYDQGNELRKYQTEPENISILPTLDPAVDVSKTNPNIYTLTTSATHPNNITYHFSENTGGLIYFKMHFPLQGKFTDKEIQFLPLFFSYLLRAGGAELDENTFAINKDLYTGGMSISTDFVEKNGQMFIKVSSSCLEKNLSNMLDLWNKVLNQPRLSNPNIMKVLLKSTITGLNSNIQGNGHGFAQTNASSSLTASAKYSEMMGGLEQLQFLKELEIEQLDEEDGDSESQPIVVRSNYAKSKGTIDINRFFDKIFNKSGQKSAFVTCSAEKGELPEISTFIDQINTKHSNSENFQHNLDLSSDSSKRHWTLEGSMVNYVSLAIKTDEEDVSKLQVLAKLISAKYTHPLIRERGGAYGSGLIPPGLGSDLKTLRYFSYRDPANLNTLATYKQTYDWAVGNKVPISYQSSDLSPWTEEDLKEAKLRAFQSIDAPVAVSNLGNSEVFQKITAEKKNKYRNDVLNVTADDIKSMAEKYLRPIEDGHDKEYEGVCIIGPTEFSLSEQNWEMRDV